MMKFKEKEDSYSHILKYTGIFGGVQGLNILMGIIRNKLVAMILGPEGMGLMSLFNSTIKLVSDSTNLGVSMSAVREISEAYEQENEEKVQHVVKLIRVWSLLTALLGMFVCILLSPLLNKWTFTWGDHTLHFVFLSPVVALMAIASGELAILKGTRQLKHLAILSVYTVFATLVTSIPLFYIWRDSAIIPSLFIVAFVQLFFTIIYSYRLFPLRLSWKKGMFGEGMMMVKLGVAFVLAGILGSGAEFLVRSYLNNVGNLSAVGLYNAGYMLTVTYSGLVFQAMETDYFPRLSSVHGIGKELDLVVNRQIEVSLLLISPLLVAFVVMAPILLPLLYSGKFMSVMGMMKITILAMYGRAIMLPIEYIALSKGDSKTYLGLELVYDFLFVVFVTLGYHFMGLTGTGIGIALSMLLALLADLAYTYFKYRYRLSHQVVLYALIQVPLGFCAYVVTLLVDGFFYWLLGCLFFIISFAVSLQILHSKTNLWKELKSRYWGRLRKKVEKKVNHNNQLRSHGKNNHSHSSV